MLNLRKTAIAVIALGSSAAFAGTMGPVCAPGPVVVPCESTGWAFGAQALYLDTVYSGGHSYYGAAVDGITSNYVERDRNWDWGFKLEASYLFGTGNDFTVNWYHLNNNDRHSRFFDFDGDGVAESAAFAFRPRWDAVNFELGQLVHFGEFKDIRFHGGAQYARIRSTTSGAVVATGIPSANDFRSMTFNGFGARAGMDMAFNWGNGFATYAKGATALLVGTSRFQRNLTNLVIPTNGLITSGHRRALVPEVEAKLGATYTFAMPAGDLALDAGYMWVNYFNAQQGVNSIAGTSFVSESDFGIHGPYFGLKWTGNIV